MDLPGEGPVLIHGVVGTGWSGSSALTRTPKVLPFRAGTRTEWGRQLGLEVPLDGTVRLFQRDLPDDVVRDEEESVGATEEESSEGTEVGEGVDEVTPPGSWSDDRTVPVPVSVC